MLRTLSITTSLAAGLLMLDVAQPLLTGNHAEAAQQKRMVVRSAPRVAPRPAPRVMARPKVFVAKKPIVVRKQFTPKIVQPKIVHPKKGFVPKNVNVQPLKKNNTVINPLQKGNPSFGAPKLNQGPKFGVLKNGPHFGKKGFGPPLAPKGNFVKFANKSWPIHKGPHKTWWKGSWKVFVPLTAISVAAIGGAYYYPDAYISVARPYCGGLTPDGCRLNWQEVPFAGGGSEFQCVQYCPRPNQPPPAQSVALAFAPPPPAAGKCEIEIFADPGFAGVNAPADADQPRLIDAGWKNEIASIQVKSGTWDFFTDEDFSGENMRLPPGPYPQLGPEWTKRIGSFMCVQGN